MTSDIERMRARLRSFDLAGLLVEELGWNHHSGSTVTISAKEQHFRATPIAEKKGPSLPTHARHERRKRLE